MARWQAAGGRIVAVAARPRPPRGQPATESWKAGQAYQRNPIDWYLVDSMHDHHMAECMQSYVCLVLISVRDKVMVAGVFHIRDKSRNL